MFYKISVVSSRIFKTAALLFGLGFANVALSFSGGDSYDFVLGPAFSSSTTRSSGLRAGAKYMPRGNFALTHGVFFGQYFGGENVTTIDANFGISIAEITSLYAGAGLRFSSAKNKPLYLALGSAFGYVSGELRRYQTDADSQLEGVISFNIPIRLFL